MTSYSGLAAYRLLRSGCGQVRHDELFRPARSECYLLDRLRARSFKTYAAMDHDGIYAEFSAGVQERGHIDTPASLGGVPVYQYNFDNSPIFDGYSVLERWWRVRNEDESPHTALYYNTITLHEGSEWRGEADWSDRDRVSRYRTSVERFFSMLERFFGLLSGSGRNVVVILVPEHGTALRGSAIQAAGLREMPMPQITRVPVGVKFFGKGWGERGTVQAIVDEPVSYQALAWLLAEIVRQPPFDPAPGLN